MRVGTEMAKDLHDSRKPADRWLLAASLCLVLLAACAELPKAPAAKAVYDFGLPAERLENADVLSQIALGVGAPPWMDEREMLYRLSWDDPQLRRSYSGSRWAATPSQLLALRWRQRLGAVMPGEGGRCQLRVRVDEFSQVFSAPESSEAMLEAAAVLVDQRGKLLARWHLTQRMSAGGDARSGAAALAKVADAAAQALREELAKPAAAGCF